ncbi:hypothetical protein E3O25_07780 [Cryobacterium sp. TMT1-3]|nr:hypothetical protein E3O25_07780 [Cryobacterium sp. TMT1-3]
MTTKARLHARCLPPGEPATSATTPTPPAGTSAATTTAETVTPVPTSTGPVSTGPVSTGPVSTGPTSTVTATTANCHRTRSTTSRPPCPKV